MLITAIKMDVKRPGWDTKDIPAHVRAAQIVMIRPFRSHIMIAFQSSVALDNPMIVHAYVNITGEMLDDRMYIRLDAPRRRCVITSPLGFRTNVATF